MNIQDTQKKLDKLVGKCVYLHGGLNSIDFIIPKRVDVARLKLALKAQSPIPFVTQDTLDYMNGVIVKVIDVRVYYNNYKRG